MYTEQGAALETKTVGFAYPDHHHIIHFWRRLGWLGLDSWVGAVAASTIITFNPPKKKKKIIKKDYKRN